MRLRRASVLLATVTAAVLFGGASPAGADPAGLGVQVRGAVGAPVVVLTNLTQQACQVITVPDGTIRLDNVAQDGHQISPLPVIPSFDDDLGFSLSKRLRALAPGASVDVPLSMVQGGPTGHALRTVSWSPLASVGSLYPIDPTKAVVLDAHYSSPIAAPAGVTLCQAGDGTGQAGQPAATSWLRWAVIGLGVLLALLVLLFVVLWLRRRRRVAPAAAALVFIAGLVAVVWSPPPAHATITGGPGVASQVAGCLAAMRAPGGDPGGILGKLDNPSVHVTISLDTGGSNGENRVGPNDIFIYWSPDDTRPFADGTPRIPCDELYHEMYHAFEDTTPQGVDNHECISADGKHSGISIKEVHATKAENARRRSLGERERTVYGTTPLPPYDCRPSKPDDPLCHPSNGCPKPPSPPPATTTTDPHVRTFDGRRFDFQGKGEFVAARDAAAADPTSALQIQVRQQPYGSNRYVTVNTAVAANVAGDRVEVDLHNGSLAVLVNGAPRTVAPDAAPDRLPKGGALRLTPRQSGDMVTIDWPDSSYLLVAVYARTLTLIASAAPVHAGHLTGLLGDDDGQPDNDLRTAKGDHNLPPTYDDLYPAYANSLRVTDATSLFTYAPGTSTTTYTDRTFPDREPPAPPYRDWAQSLCRQFGVDDPMSLRDCVVDLGYTGDAGMIPAVLVEQSISAPFRVGGSGTSVSIDKPGGVSTVSFPGTAGERLYVDVVSSTIASGCGVLTLNDPAGKAIGSGCVINGGGGIDAVTLPVTGVYTVVVQPPNGGTGQITLRLVSATDQQGGTTLNQESTLTVAQSGGVARLTFPGRKGQLIFVEILSATLPSECADIRIEDAGGQQLAAGCIINGTGFIDRTALPATGTFSLVLDPSGPGTGTARVRITDAIDQHSTVTVGGPAVTATVAQPGAQATFDFTGTAGEKVYVDVPSSTLPSQCGVLAVRAPDRSTLNTGCVINNLGSVDRTVLPVTGTYTVVIDPAEAAVGNAQVRVTQATDQIGTIAVGGPPVTATIGQPGAEARFTFTGTAGQTVTLEAPITTLPSQCGVLYIRAADDQQLASGCLINGTGGTSALTLPASGSFTVVVDPSGSATGAVTLRLHT